mmetsp:Transcript_11695/g.25649  ORF Transcript_11695/g.25649 Transcript_11695/m.25649 type:complete len:663 (+) Transcript_11695:369-2357(+)|eukprot:CAMPEP_0172298966 /NCGR_PEP_ID=MMETSP1058-20130122/1373_1 /TAXON_ID=83371 /ORGANISM="Detonula confervacea, Strain CCMP 353" /LENGTH=662 /DNA_ID=CAMNT_0013008261 /DNA_START=321 /DNA_END=2309 /DNA_ORIENTATION=-
MKLSIAIIFLAFAVTVKGDRGSYVRSGVQGALSEECGEDGSCVPMMPVRDFKELNKCFEDTFPDGRETLVKFMENGDGVTYVKKFTDPRDGTDFKDALYSSGYGLRWPAALFYAVNEDEVKDAIMCATSAGYNISPRGRGHHFQGLSAMDGHVVIDTSRLCNPEKFILDRTEADWLLPGQKQIGSIKNGAGCTNAVMLAYTARNFEANEGGVYQIGTCPSVGITGYSTGGGAGDTTPYVGWGADDVLEIEMFLYNGTKVAASEDENEDIFWAIRGGGSGLGIITTMHTVVIASPDPPEGEERRFCYILLQYKTEDNDARKKFLNALQEFLYESPESSKFGGGGGLYEHSQQIRGIFLGSKEEFAEIFSKAGLLDTDILDKEYGPNYAEDFNKISTPEGMPEFGVTVNEFNSYGEAMLYKLCDSLTAASPDNGLQMTATTGDWCKDLGISSEKCYDNPHPFDGVQDRILSPYCLDREVVGAISNAAYDPTSFFNRPGIAQNHPELVARGGSMQTAIGGLLIPKVDVDVLDEIAKVGLRINHFQHGAAMSKSSDETAWAQRDTAIMTMFAPTKSGRDDYEKITAILANKHYKDANKLQGYYNYMNPIGNPNWRYYYFGDNYARLSEIKAKYDPKNVFGNPMQVQPAVPEDSSTGSPAKTWLSSK